MPRISDIPEYSSLYENFIRSHSLRSMSYLILNVNARKGKYCTLSRTFLLEQGIFEDRSEYIPVRERYEEIRDTFITYE